MNFYQAVGHHHCPYDRYLHIIKLYALHYYYYYYYYYCCWWCCCNTNLHTHTLLVIMNNSVVEASRNVMANAQKPDFVFRRNGRVHLNRRGSQFSRLLAAEVCASAVVMLDTPCSLVVWRVLATHSIRQFPLHSPPCVPVCHHLSPEVYCRSITSFVIYLTAQCIYQCPYFFFLVCTPLKFPICSTFAFVIFPVVWMLVV